MLPGGPTSFDKPLQDSQFPLEFTATNDVSKPNIVASNDNVRPLKLTIKQWIGRLRFLLLPVVGAAILIFAMAHA